MRALFHGFLLAIALLLTQQGAVLHELGHAMGTAASSDGTHHEHPGASDLCVACVAFSQIASGAAPDVVPPSLLGGLSHATALAPRVVVAAAEPLPPRSRGPPRFL